MKLIQAAAGETALRQVEAMRGVTAYFASAESVIVREAHGGAVQMQMLWGEVQPHINAPGIPAAAAPLINAAKAGGRGFFGAWRATLGALFTEAGDDAGETDRVAANMASTAVVGVPANLATAAAALRDALDALLAVEV